MNDEIRAALEELVAAIGKKWDDETERRRMLDLSLTG